MPSIEEAIKQKEFASSSEKLSINILFTASWLNTTHSQLLRPFDLTPQQYNVLRILRGQKGGALSVNDINCRMVDKMSNGSRLVEKLRIKKLVHRQESKDDRRTMDVMITSQGLDVLTAIDPKISQHRELFSNLEDHEIALLNDLLDKLRN
jgi:DNA-binding MarR family transcriptional regulator